MKYQTSIRDDTSSDAFEAEIEFTLLKTVDCKNSKLKNIYINKLNRLKNENFNRVKIPKFTYSVDGTTVFCIIDFIKGEYINTLEQQKIIYEFYLRLYLLLLLKNHFHLLNQNPHII